MEVLVADTLGFCKGVEKAVKSASEAVERARKENRKVYFYGQLVHNEYVSSRFTREGAVVIKSPGETEEGSLVVIRAHGISDSERAALEERHIEIVDATCPLVLKGQNLVRSSVKPVLIFGYRGHSEVNTLVGSTVGECRVISREEDLEEVPGGEYSGVVQTTFSIPLLKKLLEKAGEKDIIVNVLNHICTASVRRRESVHRLIHSVDGFVIVGDANSANTGELRAIVEKCGIPCFLVDSPFSVPREVYSLQRIGLSAGASTPRELYEKVIEVLED